MIARAALVALLCAAPAAAQQAEPAARGAEIAARWCAECHATGGAEARAADVGPTFPAIAARRSDDYLRGFLANPHLRGAMPPFDLAERQIEDLVAYLAAMR